MGLVGVCWIVEDKIVFDGGIIHINCILKAYERLMEGLFASGGGKMNKSNVKQWFQMGYLILGVLAY